MNYTNALLRFYRRSITAAELAGITFESSFKVKTLQIILKWLTVDVARRNLDWWVRSAIFKSSRACFGKLDLASVDLDQLTIRGWIFCPDTKGAKLALTVLGKTYSVLIYGDRRKDVMASFPAEPVARKSGFYLVVPWKGNLLDRISPSFTLSWNKADTTLTAKGFFDPIAINKSGTINPSQLEEFMLTEKNQPTELKVS